MKHKMWSRLLSMALAVMMIVSIVPNSAFAEAANEITSTSQVQEIPAEETQTPEEVTVPEAETPAEPSTEPAPTEEPVAEPTAEPTVEPTAEPTQAPAETAVPSEQPSAEPTAAPEGTQTPEGTEAPEGTAVPSETPAASATPAPSESPVPSETPAPSETPEATEEPVAMNEEAYEATAQVENADITVTVKVPEGALPVDAELKAELIAEETEEFAQAQAALDEQQVEYDGMIALDIRFELNGEEIEPLFPVEVTIDAKAMLPENADPETVAVQHLEENENGEVTAVETVADATEATGDVTVEATQTEEPAMDMASTFAVDGFSSFTITWSYRRSITVVYAEEVKGGYQEINVTGAPTGSVNSNNVKSLAAYRQYAEDDGYNVTDVVREYTTYYGGKQYVKGIVEITGNRGSVSYTTNNGSGRFNDGDTLYIVCERAGVSIEDDIINRGRLNAVLGESVAGEGVTYKWYRNETKVTPVKVSGDNYNVSTDAHDNWLNVALDIESLCMNAADDSEKNEIRSRTYTYRVEVYSSTGEVVGTASYTVPYYAQLLNGSFETPVVDYWNNQLANGTADLIWTTTGEGPAGKLGQDIEIVRSDDTGFWDGGGYKTYQEKVNEIYGAASARDGVQFAELNCEAYGALYQDVLTTPGSELNWYLSHRARTNERNADDTMALVIMPTSQADQVTKDLEDAANSWNSSEEIKAVLKRIQGQDGVFVKTFTDDVYHWEDYNGIYTINENSDQYLTRFFFVAVSTGSGDSTVGNLLDDVWFSTDLPEPSADKGNLQIVKQVDGIAKSEVPAESFQFTVTKDGKFFDTFTLPTENGSWQYSKIDVEPGKYVVEETQPGNIGGYTYSSTSVNGEVGKTYTIAVNEGSTGSATFVNTYTSGDMDLTITKKFVNEKNTPIDTPTEVAEIRLTVQEYYTVTEGGVSKEKVVDDYSITLSQKDAFGNFTGTLENVRYYTQFRITDEKVIDSSGKELAGYTTGSFVIDRYTKSTIRDVSKQTATGGNYFELSSAGFILVEDGNQWYLTMRYLPDSADREQVKNDIFKAVETAKNSNKLSAIPGSVNEIQWATLDEVENAYDATIVYGDDGITKLDFKGSQVWDQFIYGVYDIATMSISAELTNNLDTETKHTITITKKWEGDDAQTRPNSVSISVKNGSATLATVVVTGSSSQDVWNQTVEVDKYNDNGTLISYTIEETVPKGYTATYDQADLTVTNTPSEGYLKINKVIQGDAFGGGKDVFSFKIEDASGKTWYMHVDGGGDAYYAVDGEGRPLTELKLDAGEYTVTELDNINYQFVNVDSTDTKDVQTGHSITVTVSGNETTQVTFANTRKDDPGMTDGSGVINQFKKENGEITFDKIWIANDDDEPSLSQQGGNQ